MKVNLVNENFEHDYLKQLLTARGVTDIDKYINSDESCLNDPMLLDNIKEGAELLDSILNKENSNILLVVDCDVDGFTSSAIIWHYIKSIKPNQDITYILHEHKEHGLQDHIENIINNNKHYDLVILPDSSSNDYNYHELLGQHNMKCLILDHHEIDSDQAISDNAIIINNQLSPNYPNKDLTGAGVAWKFCMYHDGINNTNIAADLIDLAALGICGDMGSILDLENRYIMMAGFHNIKNYFFKSAIEKQSYSLGNELTPIGIAFYIVPMINSLIRLGTMEEKERLFLAFIDGHKKVPCNKRGAKGTMEKVAIESLRECTNAKAKQNRITDQMVSDLEQRIFKYDLLENKILFICLDDDDDYPQEINGLACMRLAAKYKHPTIVARINDGYIKGSARGLNQSELDNFKEFLNNSGYFEFAQGHASAFGLSIKEDRLDSFLNYANEKLKNIDFNEEFYDVNFIRDVSDIDLKDLVYDLANQPNIYGQNCPEPLIYIPDIRLDYDQYKIIGSNKDTIKFELNGITYIKFHASLDIEALQRCNEIKINLVGKPNINNWMGKSTPQILIEDWEIVDELLEF